MDCTTSMTLQGYMPRKHSSSITAAEPPAWHLLPIIHAPGEVERWLDHYWKKLGLPPEEKHYLAITQDRQEYTRWTGRRLNSRALGCYCYLPTATDDAQRSNHAQSMHEPSVSPDLAGIHYLMMEETAQTARHAPIKHTSRGKAKRYRHLIFIEPDLLPMGVEVTVAHELIHLSDRFKGEPRKHHCHGYDSIAVDEAIVTGYDPEDLRSLLREESNRRESTLRQARPIKYVYSCPNCGKEYPRTRRYSRQVSCGLCDKQYNPDFILKLKSALS